MDIEAIARMTERRLLSGVADTMLIVKIKEFCKEQRDAARQERMNAMGRNERSLPNRMNGKAQAFNDVIRFIDRLQKGREDMLTTFEIRVVSEVDTNKPDDVGAFKDLMKQEAQILWTTCTAMAPGTIIEVSMSNLEEGAVQLHLFNDQTLPE